MSHVRGTSGALRKSTFSGVSSRASYSSPHSPYLKYGSLTGFVSHPELHSRTSLIGNVEEIN